MNRLADYFFAFGITLWVGALWAIGLIAAPVLFNALGNAAQAGVLAGRMFVVVAWIGVVVACYAIVYLFFKDGLRSLQTAVFWFIVGMLLLTLAGHFGINPILAALKSQALPREVMQSVLRDRFIAWHGVSSVLYLIQSALGLALVTQTFKR